MKIALILLLLSIHSVSQGQDIPYAKEVIHTLCAPEMKGRGYVDQGDRKAADFIAGEFKKIGLKKFTDDYLQPFSIPVNSLPGTLTLAVNKKELTPGKDYLVDPGSPSFSGKHNTLLLTADDLVNGDAWIKKLQHATDRFAVIEAYDKKKYDKDQLKKIHEIISFLRYHPDNPALGTVVLTEDKLTWSGAVEQFSKPSLTIHTSSLAQLPKTISLTIESKFYEKYETQNVAGYIEGQKKDSMLVFIAHYDHLGMMGKEALFPGANDNASGIAMLLNLAKYYAKNPPRYTAVFIAFGAEEVGLLGSHHFVENPLIPLEQIKFLINFDISGTGDDGIQIVNGSIYQDKFDKITALNDRMQLLPQIKIRGEACNSDHCMFHRKGVPCFFIYTLGGIQAYHDIYDRAETLPLTEFGDYFKLITAFMAEIN